MLVPRRFPVQIFPGLRAVPPSGSAVCSVPCTPAGLGGSDFSVEPSLAQIPASRSASCLRVLSARVGPSLWLWAAASSTGRPRREGLPESGASRPCPG